MTVTSTHTLSVPGIGAVEVLCSERGTGRAFVVLHGGGGPATVEPWADTFAATVGARVVVPVHPGFGGTSRPGALDSIGGLARVYVALLDELGLSDVVVVGNSIGGWTTAEMAVLGSPRVSGYVLVDAVGAEVAGHAGPDFFALTPQQVAEHAWFDPIGRALDPSSLPPAARAVLASDRAALAVYGGESMTDPTLLGRLASVATPTLAVWGEADRIADPAVGRSFAAAIPGARFVLLPRAGHLPQLEQPEALAAVVREFADSVGATA